MIGAIQAVNISGSLTLVVPAIEDGYIAGQKAYLYIEADLLIRRSWYDTGFILVSFDIFKSDHTRIARVDKTRTLWAWETEVQWDISFMQAAGYMPSMPLSGYIEMVWGETLLANRSFTIPLKGENGNGGNGDGEGEFPWKTVAVVAGIVTVAAVAIKMARR